MGRKKGEKYLESDGKGLSAWISCWKSQVLAMARLQRREGQLRAFRSSCFGVCHGAHKIARATLACNFSSESVSSAEMAPSHSGLAYSKIGRTW